MKINFSTGSATYEQRLKPTLWQDIKANKSLVLMTVPALVFFIVFAYLPMFGLYIAFVNYNPVVGILRSQFVGLRNFRFFFESGSWVLIVKNTLLLNVMFIAGGTIASVAIAIMLSEIRGRLFKKVTQSLVILPHFISWTVVAMFSVALISSQGYFNQIFQALGWRKVEFYTDPSVWPAFLLFLKIWSGAGFGSIIYLAAITGIDQDIYEAARIDGASRLKSILFITLPLLKDTIIMMLILSVGKIFYGDFGMIYALVGNNSMLYPTTDVIDTYVYRALMQLGDMGMSSAVGFCQSLIGFIFVVGSNSLARKFSPDSAMF